MGLLGISILKEFTASIPRLIANHMSLSHSLFVCPSPPILPALFLYLGLVSAFGEQNQKRSPCSEDELIQLKQLQDLFYTSCTSGVSGECKSNLQ